MHKFSTASVRTDRQGILLLQRLREQAMGLHVLGKTSCRLGSSRATAWHAGGNSAALAYRPKHQVVGSETEDKRWLRAAERCDSIGGRLPISLGTPAFEALRPEV